MRVIIVCLLAFCISISSGFAQGSTNYLQLSTGASWDFSCNNASDLESSHTISNAFSIKIRSKSSNCSVYVKMSSYTLPYGAPTPSFSPLYADFSSDNSPNAYNEASSINIQNYDQLMFNQPKTSGSSAYTFYYKLRLAALGYDDFVPGTYNYTLTFTMTQP